MTSSKGDPSTNGGSGATFFDGLLKRILRRYPEWSGLGTEDPSRVLLETFAQVLHDAHARIEDLEDRTLTRILESLGEDSRWASPATGAVVFAAMEGLQEPMLVPAGTILSAPRRSGEPKLGFETLGDVWCSSARLARVVTCAGNQQSEIFPYPESGWDGAPTSLFLERAEFSRYLYLGDPVIGLLRDHVGSLVLEWPGVPGVLLEGSWEIRVRGGWRAIAVEFEECRSVKGKRAIRMRILGPAPDLAEERLEGGLSPWIRLSLPGDRRIVLPQPSWMGAEFQKNVSPKQLEVAGWPGGAQALSFPRPIFRVLSTSGERWEDHSLSGQKIVPTDSLEAWDPAVYMGWENPVPSSVYWSLVRPSVPEGWDLQGRGRFPRLEWQYSSGRGFRPLDARDSTLGFSRSGTVSWDLPSEWTPQDHFGERLFWIRARWVAGHYASAPLVRAVLPHAAAVRQGRAITNHVMETTIGRDGRGILDLSFLEGEPERFGVLELKREPGDWERLADEDSRPSDGPPSPPDEAKGKVTGRFRLLRNARGEYVLEVEPRWAGPVRVRIPRLRALLGARGNVPAGTLTTVEASIAGLSRAVQPIPTDGGMDPETREAARRRVAAEWKTGDRLVTAPDFRRYALTLDPEIARVEISASEEEPDLVAITVVSREPCRPSRFSPAKLEWLGETLGRKAPLGTIVRVVEPIYLPVEVRLSRLDEGPRPPAAACEVLQERLRDFLHPLRGGPDGRGFPLRSWLKLQDLSDMIWELFLKKWSLAPQASEAAAEVAGGPAVESPPSVWRSVALKDLTAGDWDPRSWRLDCRRIEGVAEPRSARPGGASPLVVPVLERLVVEPQDER